MKKISIFAPTKELRDGLSHQRIKFELPKLTKEATLRIIPQHVFAWNMSGNKKIWLRAKLVNNKYD